MSQPMSPMAVLLTEHGPKALRYCGVSVVNVIVGQGTLGLALVVFGWPGFGAQLLAWFVSTPFAYVMSRRWVWRQQGPNHFRSEILPFWILALAGLVCAVGTVSFVDSLTDSAAVIMLSSLVAFGVVWVAKYLVLDKLMWRDGVVLEPVEVA